MGLEIAADRRVGMTGTVGWRWRSIRDRDGAGGGPDMAMDPGLGRRVRRAGHNDLSGIGLVRAVGRIWRFIGDRDGGSGGPDMAIDRGSGRRVRRAGYGDRSGLGTVGAAGRTRRRTGDRDGGCSGPDVTIDRRRPGDSGASNDGVDNAGERPDRYGW